MGMADEVNDRLSASQSEQQSREVQRRKNLADFSAVMDTLAREFVSGAEGLKLKPTDKGSWGLRGWYVFAFFFTKPPRAEMAEQTQALDVLIKTDGTWVWAKRDGYRVKVDDAPRDGLMYPPDRDRLRQRLVDLLHDQARLKG
jgi:hypothetical protein